MFGLSDGSGARSDLGPVQASVRSGIITLTYPSLKHPHLRDHGLVVRLSYQQKDTDNVPADSAAEGRGKAWNPVKLVNWPGCGIHAVIPKGCRLRAHMLSARGKDDSATTPCCTERSPLGNGKDLNQRDDGAATTPSKTRVRVAISRRQDDAVAKSRSSTLVLRVTASALPSGVSIGESASTLLAELVIRYDGGGIAEKKGNGCVPVESKTAKKPQPRSRLVTVSREDKMEPRPRKSKPTLYFDAALKTVDVKAQLRSRLVTRSREDDAESSDDESESEPDCSPVTAASAPPQKEKVFPSWGGDAGALPPSAKRRCFGGSFDGGGDLGCSLDGLSHPCLPRFFEGSFDKNSMDGSFGGLMHRSLSKQSEDIALDDDMEFDDHERRILNDFTFGASIGSGTDYRNFITNDEV